ncbi:acyl-CoA dehydrogenase [Pyrodictium delaneyi]|uniref:Acyl-CoA dehydrogenase n=1 Tax=Pyrodictium delaneyi TaxID=1273541 RepID=A0A0P0N1S6_9CREN|nr:acyl-CoA dehydrogenase family protein [Pyrodictium delaneyi]ALL00474.1 acyl-CoA dehydrogenase [Pyrodictium delaneyi]OWJ53945.1 acyl-CoA dehydrogenase [Pyrodictium delaneyi]
MVLPFQSLEDFRVELTEEHELFRKAVRSFVEEHLEPRAMEIEKTDRIPDELFEEARKLGLFGVGIPEEYGGQGGGHLMEAILMEELSRVSPAFGTAVAVRALFTTPILLFGTEEQKKQYVTPVARGEKFAAHANTEPCCGSDVAGMQTRAKKVNGHYVITGRKIFITGADKADYFVVSARTSPPKEDKRWWGITVFIVERDTPGLKVGQRFNVTGLRGERPHEVILDEVKVPEENVVGPVDQGFKVIVSTYDHTRVGIAAQAVGIAQGAFEKALNYALQRQAFGRPIISFEGIAFKLADMLMQLEAARLLAYWAATLADKGDKKFVIAASIAKTFATEVAERVANMAIKIHGGVGVDIETGVERYLRDALITTIYEGANDIQRLTIIRQMLKDLFGIKLVLT